MGEQGNNSAGGGGLKLLCLKLILGALAAIVGMGLMRVLGGAEFVVAVLIGIVPGMAEKSTKKAVAGAVLGLVGYFVGARVGAAIGAAPWNPFGGVPLLHWAVTGGFIGLTSGISRRADQWFSPRLLATVLGANLGFFLGFLFGVLGDMTGLIAAFAIPNTPPLIYMRITELSLLCAGIFINLAAAAGSGLEARLDKKAPQAAETAEEPEA